MPIQGQDETARSQARKTPLNRSSKDILALSNQGLTVPQAAA
jgi:hypothetical protein